MTWHKKSQFECCTSMDDARHVTYNRYCRYMDATVKRRGYLTSILLEMTRLNAKNNKNRLKIDEADSQRDARVQELLENRELMLVAGFDRDFLKLISILKLINSLN